MQVACTNQKVRALTVAKDTLQGKIPSQLVINMTMFFGKYSTCSGGLISLKGMGREPLPTSYLYPGHHVVDHHDHLLHCHAEHLPAPSQALEILHMDSYMCVCPCS